MENVKNHLKVLALGLVIGLLIAYLSYVIEHSIGLEKLASKTVVFNAIFLASINWWYSLIARAHDLKKYESSLSSIQDISLTSIIGNLSNLIWCAIAFNVLGSVVTLMSYIFAGASSKLDFVLLSLYFLFTSLLLLMIFPFVKNRIENANVMLSRREKEEKNKIEILKSLKDGLEKFQKEERFESYNNVAQINQPEEQ